MNRKLMAIFVVLVAGFSFYASGKTIEFRIPKGSAAQDWNTKETLIKVQVGDTIHFVNDDTEVHALHTGGVPCKHTGDFEPNGGTYDADIIATYDSEASGPLHDHYNTGAHFWITATDQEE